MMEVDFLWHEDLRFLQLFCGPCTTDVSSTTGLVRSWLKKKWTMWMWLRRAIAIRSLFHVEQRSKLLVPNKFFETSVTLFVIAGCIYEWERGLTKSLVSGIWSSWRSWRKVLHFVHSTSMSSGSGESQSLPCLESSRSSFLTCTVTGARKPRGSNTQWQWLTLLFGCIAK